LRFLIVDPHYPEAEELSTEFESRLRRRASETFGNSATLQEVDAGPSASVPAYFFTVGDAADLLAILGAPLILRKGLQGWRDWFARAATFLRGLGLTYSIDLQTAVLLSASALFETGNSEEGIEVVSVTRHWVNLGGPGSDHLFASELGAASEPLDMHFEAVKQLDAHYIVLLQQGSRCFTALADRRGDLLHLEELGSR
jgi:hypothetical protein